MHAYQTTYGFDFHKRSFYREFFNGYVPNFLKLIEEKRGKKEKKEVGKSLDSFIDEYLGNDKEFDKDFVDVVTSVCYTVINHKIIQKPEHKKQNQV